MDCDAIEFPRYTGSILNAQLDLHTAIYMRSR